MYPRSSAPSRTSEKPPASAEKTSTVWPCPPRRTGVGNARCVEGERGESVGR
jgi:hypothetical protein